MPPHWAHLDSGSKLDPAYPPERITELVVATLPALGAAVFAASSSALNALSDARRAAVTEAAQGRSQQALMRYARSSAEIELRWLVLRILGVTWSALLIAASLEPGKAAWVWAAFGAMFAYAIPAEIGRAIVMRIPDKAAPLLLRVLFPLEVLALPIAAPIVALGRLVSRWVASQPTTPKVTETEVEIIVNEGELNGSLDHDQSEMLRNVLDFSSIIAGELMVPRTQVTAFEIGTSMEDVLREVHNSEHSRYPVYRETIENVFGVLHVKDLISRAAEHDLKELSLKDIVRKPVAFVPESQSASSVLKDMRAGRHHLAVVIDEFGGMSGIVTLEDLIEEIVGDIRDEHDVEEDPPIVDLGDGRLMVDASVSITDLSRYLGVDLPEDGDYNSLGGFVVARFGRVPRVGAKFSAFGFEFSVREADERHVVKVEIVRTPSSESMSPRSTRASAV